jgi:hypothetical protein
MSTFRAGEVSSGSYGSQPDLGSIADVTHLLAGVIHRRQVP